MPDGSLDRPLKGAEEGRSPEAFGGLKNAAKARIC